MTCFLLLKICLPSQCFEDLEELDLCNLDIRDRIIGIHAEISDNVTQADEMASRDEKIWFIWDICRGALCVENMVIGQQAVHLRDHGIM